MTLTSCSESWTCPAPTHCVTSYNGWGRHLALVIHLMLQLPAPTGEAQAQVAAETGAALSEAA
jgi:hypothetical protein